jgi:membrane associated rhomboid family serine protease
VTLVSVVRVVEHRRRLLYRARYMTWLDKLEKRIGFIAVPGLIRIVIAFNVLVYLLVFMNRGFESFLTLDRDRILQGEVWRLFTYIFVPQTFSPLWLILALWFLWFIGDGLERAWGPFRLTLYFIVGMIGTTIAAFFFGSNFSNSMLISSLFFAFARFYPDLVIYILFVLPAKIKWLAWVYGALLLVGLVIGTNSYRMAVVAALSNYLIFFGPDIIHDTRHRHEVSSRRKRFEGESRSEEEAMHKCAVCGATELTDPSLDFRVARDGEEYCVPHLPSAKPAAS